MKLQLDTKSIMIGFLSAALLISAFSFKNDSSGNGGKYQTSMGERGIIILDTETGAYIINTDATNSGWRKGNFENTFKVSKDNLDRK
ncbi:MULTISPECIES: hypothetical protein [Rufibacter]|uniref:Uncharacterized protein n=1 Tax=Rufibacter quisquiliarum TaxID=1549639 RepID=A0A839GPT1_9BACT|nr:MULTISPECIES: hypothetical protein [Rufibacter]MBA9076896.1 hypothetical protein [Rufibacter quisquiliarum]